LVEFICERVKSVEKVRFCNSVTEARMNPIRGSRIIVTFVDRFRARIL
jgi:glutamate-1-semialdehyde aminotransferase